MEQYVFMKRLKGLKVKKIRFLESHKAQRFFSDKTKSLSQDLVILALTIMLDYLPNTSIQENSSMPLVIKTFLIAYILPNQQVSS